MEEQKEIWKDIQDFEGIYQVSNMGRIKSIPRKGRKTELILTPTPNTTGYMIIGLRKRGFKVKSCLVHRLVLMAFDPITNAEDMEGNHKDFDITNNKLSNLEWTTPQENTDHFLSSDRPKDKTKTTGINHHLCVLNEDIVRELRKLSAEGYSTNGLAKRFGIAEATARYAINGVTWKHVA